jgi:hypothetical protein
MLIFIPSYLAAERGGFVIERIVAEKGNDRRILVQAGPYSAHFPNNTGSLPIHPTASQLRPDTVPNPSVSFSGVRRWFSAVLDILEDEAFAWFWRIGKKGMN